MGFARRVLHSGLALKLIIDGATTIKQGYALKNWMEGLSDEAYYPWESQKKSTKIGQPYFCQLTKESFD